MGGLSQRARYGIAVAVVCALLATLGTTAARKLDGPERAARTTAHDVWPSDPRLRLPLDQGGTTLPPGQELLAGASSAIVIPAGLHRIPGRVLAAYQQGEKRMDGEQPSCHLSWPLLAAIGKVESSHARGGDVDASGTTNAPILGPKLDGGESYATIGDHDGGRLDGDPRYDRAVGPMQFLPTSWELYGRDGNADRAKNPHNVFDASYGAAAHLCSGGRDMADQAQLEAAIFGYNHSQTYVQTVLAWMRTYQGGVVSGRDGTTVVAASPAPVVSAPPPSSPTPSAPPAGPPPAKPPASPDGTPTPTPVAPGSIAGTVVDDLDRPVAGVRVTVTGPVVKAATSDENGVFAVVDLPPGTYGLTQETAAGYADANPSAIPGIEVTSGQQRGGYVFRLGTAGLSGLVYEDADGDGLFGEGEPGIADVPVRLVGTDDRGRSIDLTLRTGADGTFAFTGLLAGGYTLIEVEQPAGYADGDESGPVGDRSVDEEIRDIPLNAGARLGGFGFGELAPAPAPTAETTEAPAEAPAGEGG